MHEGPGAEYQVRGSPLHACVNMLLDWSALLELKQTCHAVPAVGGHSTLLWLPHMQWLSGTARKLATM